MAITERTRLMLLTCPNCETVFRVDRDSIGETGKSVRCSVCAHIWKAFPPMLAPEETRGEVQAALRTILLPLLVLIMLVGIGTGSVMQRSTVTAYLPALLPVYEKLGLPVMPRIDQLEIVDLTAEYAGDTLRLRGRLFNRAAFFAHAPMLEVTVSSETGDALLRQVIGPDGTVIRPASTVPFFVQLVIDDVPEPTVTVIMLDDLAQR